MQAQAFVVREQQITTSAMAQIFTKLKILLLSSVPAENINKSLDFFMSTGLFTPTHTSPSQILFPAG
jgi:hypothetical protein